MDEQRHRDLEHLRLLLDEPQLNVEEIDRTFLRLVARQFAFVAREGYQREGRGAIILGWVGNTICRKNTINAQPYYLSLSKDETSRCNWPVAELREQVETYNPLRELIVCMLRTPHSSIYRLLLPQTETKTLGNK